MLLCSNFLHMQTNILFFSHRRHPSHPHMVSASTGFFNVCNYHSGTVVQYNSSHPRKVLQMQLDFFRFWLLNWDLFGASKWSIRTSPSWFEAPTGINHWKGGQPGTTPESTYPKFHHITPEKLSFPPKKQKVRSSNYQFLLDFVRVYVKLQCFWHHGEL